MGVEGSDSIGWASKNFIELTHSRGVFSAISHNLDLDLCEHRDQETANCPQNPQNLWNAYY